MMKDRIDRNKIKNTVDQRRASLSADIDQD